MVFFANLIVLRNGTWSLYYDHWCANRIDIELFWGPEAATRFIEQATPVAVRGEWLDDVWAEGGCIVDHDARVLLWFGGEDIAFHVLERQTQMELMQRTWPGWVVRWAAGGIAELGTYLAEPPERFLADDAPDPADTFEASTESGYDLLLVVVQSGQASLAALDSNCGSLLQGQACLDDLLAVPRHPGLAWDHFPVGGFTLDLDDRFLGYWYADYSKAGFERRVAEAWPDWSTQWWRDDYSKQLDPVASALTLPTPSKSALRSTVLRRLRAHAHNEPSNPAREFQRKGGQLNPLTDETRGSVGSIDMKLRVISALERDAN